MWGERLRIGVAVADMSAFEAVDPAYGIGDQHRQVAAAFDAARARGDLPVHGRDVEVVVRTFDAVDVGNKRSTADAFARDGVLAVVGARDFTYGAVALAERHDIPVVDVNAVPSGVLRRCEPWLFTLRCAQDVLYRTFVRWAHRERLLGERVGIFSDRYTGTSAALVVDELERLGYPVVAHVDSDGLGYGSDQDEAAVDRFRHASVDTVLPFVSGSSLVELLRAADASSWVPRIVDLETGEHATDVAGSLMPPAIYDGTRALVMSRIGEAAAGMDVHGVTAAALDHYERATGRSLPRWGRDSSGELSNVLLVNDLVAILVRGLHHAGSDPDRAALARGLTFIRDLPAASAAPLSFEPGEPWGVRSVRPVRWDASRGAWIAEGSWVSVDTG